MKILYECEYCHEQFNNKNTCMRHEESHLKDVDKFKYHVVYVNKEPLCKYCEHVYYVYGCEENCEYKDCSPMNCYKDFKLGGLNLE